MNFCAERSDLLLLAQFVLVHRIGPFDLQSLVAGFLNGGFDRGKLNGLRAVGYGCLFGCQIDRCLYNAVEF